MKKLALLGLVSLFLLSGAAGADQAGEQKGASPMGGMMEQMMSGTDMGGMGGMMGMMNMMGEMGKMMDQCSAMMESMHKEAATSKKPEEK